MNNYANMGYMPNDFGYYNQMPNQNNNYMNQMQAQGKMMAQNKGQGKPSGIKNDYMTMNAAQYGMSGGMMNSDTMLVKKLKNQSGDNMNFNKPNYVQNANPNDLYDVYTGFIRGNMFPDLYNGYKISKPFEVEPMNEQAELLTYVDAYCFAAHDLNLYLDTHPNDKAMIQLFETFSNEAEKAIKEYESKFGPLYVNDTKGYSWAWNDSPWPWENM